MGVRRLIVSADDFGMTEGVTRGIVEGHRRGIVSSTALMANMPARHLAAALARQHPRLGVGLHLNRTCYRPLLPPEQVPSLVMPNGWFWPTVEMADHHNHIDELEAEFRRQLAEFKALGLRLTHMDMHMGTRRPDVLKLVVRLVREEGVPARRPPKDYAPGLDAFIESLRTEGLRFPDQTLYDLQERQVSAQELRELLLALPAGASELVTHPGYISEAHRFVDDFYNRRECELAVLTDPALPAWLEQLGIQIITFGEL